MILSFQGDWQVSISKYVPLRKKKKKENYLNGKQRMTAADKRPLLLCSSNLKKIHRTPLYDFFMHNIVSLDPMHICSLKVLCYLWITAVPSLIIHQLHFSLPKVL